MIDPVIYDTNRYHDQLAENGNRWIKAQKQAASEIKYMDSREWRWISAAMHDLSELQLREMADSMNDDAALGELVRIAVIRHRAEEIYEANKT